MDHVDNILGNLIIKHEDARKGTFFLKQDLTFTSERTQAGRFYLLKPGNTTILNGDKITVNVGSRTLAFREGSLVLFEREEAQSVPVVITDGSEDTRPISYGSTVFFIVDKEKKTALKKSSRLLVDEYAGITDINLFKFVLEKTDEVQSNTKTVTKPLSFVESNKGIVVVLLLLLLLILTFVAGHA